jgi:photosystem II stability/assembly factor-like uncharacterized protein
MSRPFTPRNHPRPRVVSVARSLRRRVETVARCLCTRPENVARPLRRRGGPAGPLPKDLPLDRTRARRHRRRGLLAAAALSALVLAGCGGSSAGSSTPPARAENHLHSIAIVPGHPDEAYFGAHYYLYQTTDGGKQWARLTKQMMLSLALEPQRATTLFAVSLQRGLVESRDAGKHWSTVTSSIPKGNVTGVTVAPSAGTVFAYGAGIYRSADGGAHWTHARAGDSVSSMTGGVGNTVFAATGNGLLVSSDGGRSWKAQKTIGAQPVVQVASSGSTVYAVTAVGLMKSTDDGTTWTTLSKAPIGIEFMAVAPSDPRQIVAEVSQKGFYSSSDGGATWQSGSGIHDRKFNGSTVQVAAANPEIAYTGAWGLNIYATHDGGRHWVKTATLK